MKLIKSIISHFAQIHTILIITKIVYNFNNLSFQFINDYESSD